MTGHPRSLPVPDPTCAICHWAGETTRPDLVWCVAKSKVVAHDAVCWVFRPEGLGANPPNARSEPKAVVDA